MGSCAQLFTPPQSSSTKAPSCDVQVERERGRRQTCPHSSHLANVHDRTGDGVSNLRSDLVSHKICTFAGGLGVDCPRHGPTLPCRTCYPRSPPGSPAVCTPMSTNKIQEKPRRLRDSPGIVQGSINNTSEEELLAEHQRPYERSHASLPATLQLFRLDLFVANLLAMYFGVPLSNGVLRSMMMPFACTCET